MLSSPMYKICTAGVAHLANGSYLAACTSGAVTSTSNQDSEVEEAVAGNLSVQVTPNPATSYFTLSTCSNSETPMQIRVVIALGSVVEL